MEKTGITARRMARHLAGLCLVSIALASHADTLVLKDGSSLRGTLVRVTADEVIFRTAFAGELTIERDNLAGITTDSPVVSELEDGSRLVGELRHSPESGQTVQSNLVGQLPLASTRIGAVWPQGEPAPEELASQAAAEAHARELQELRDQQKEPHELWSGLVALGFSGSDGNTDKHTMNARVEARRETDFDRLLLALKGRSASDQGEQTEAEIMGSATLERDFTERWFAFGETSFERDRFEGIDLRAMLSGGLGYFLIREPDHEWKTRLGVGYQFEAPQDGDNEGEIVLSLGYDWWRKLLGGTRVGHKLTYFPTVENPGSDYRVESEFSVRHPLTKDEALDIGFSLLHQYDALPPEDVKKLDTQYNLNIGYTFD